MFKVYILLGEAKCSLVVILNNHAQTSSDTVSSLKYMENRRNGQLMLLL